MSGEIEQPFESIESAYQYMDILAITILDAMGELKRQQNRALEDGNARKAQAIGLATYKLKTLGVHVYKSRRDLNDLRTLRRLILNERASVENAMTAV